MNKASILRLTQVHPALSYRVNRLFSQLNFDCEVTQGLRTYEEQDALFNQIPKVTEVRGGYSAHNFGYAVDVVPEDLVIGTPDWNVNHPAWQLILQTALKCGFAEGACWKIFPDNPHLYLVELPAEPTDQMRSDFSTGGLTAVWSRWRVGNV